MMALIASPVACSERIAASRPDPGPFTYTSSVRRPCSIALRAALSGESATAVFDGQSKFEVPVRLTLAPERQAALASTLALPVLTTNGDTVPLSEIVRVEPSTREAARHRKDLLPVTYVVGEVAGGADSPLYGMFAMRDELARVGRMPPARAVAIALQIARALRGAQAHGVVHRDLKPENIMLLNRYGERDYVKVLDFGIARSLHRTGADFRTGTGAILGTPQYMSPEQCEGKPVDARSDLYALGAVGYFLLTGEDLFDVASPAAAIVAACEPTRRSIRDAKGLSPANRIRYHWMNMKSKAAG